ncbi:MAG: hypothetical protein PHH40_01910 [Candidatus Moranbacteria bacterium]|nr:hypothetical protein [Candidatus Moranbacteria bacterium]MDD3965025.1 hypothetical protein [Candidatus Moranbacteria bacterium]
MQTVVPEYHTKTIKLLRESAEYESVASLYIEQLQQKIASIDIIRHSLLYELDEYYIDLLEKGLRPHAPLVDARFENCFKEARREVYQYFEFTVARLESQIRQSLQIVENRKKSDAPL